MRWTEKVFKLIKKMKISYLNKILILKTFSKKIKKKNKAPFTYQFTP